PRLCSGVLPMTSEVDRKHADRQAFRPQLSILSYADRHPAKSPLERILSKASRNADQQICLCSAGSAKSGRVPKDSDGRNGAEETFPSALSLCPPSAIERRRGQSERWRRVSPSDRRTHHG